MIVIEQLVPPEEFVGSLKQGLVCLPAGKIKAFQLRMPTAETLSQEMPKRAAWTSGRKFRGVITKLDVSVCTSWMGIASTKPKGKMLIEVAWSLVLPGEAETSCRTKVKVSLDGDDPRLSERPMISAISASLADAERCLSDLATAQIAAS